MGILSPRPPRHRRCCHKYKTWILEAPLGSQLHLALHPEPPSHVQTVPLGLLLLLFLVWRLPFSPSVAPTGPPGPPVSPLPPWGARGGGGVAGCGPPAFPAPFIGEPQRPGTDRPSRCVHTDRSLLGPPGAGDREPPLRRPAQLHAARRHRLRLRQ